MKPYKDTDRDSWVIAYEYWDDYIKVKFSSNVIYMYTYASAWSVHIEKMKKLADLWDWLNAYIIVNKVKHSSKN